MVIVIVIPRCCMYGIIAYIWRKCMVNALVDILCMEHTGYLLYKPTSCCFPLQGFFLYPFFTHGLPGMCVPWRAPFGSPRWTSRVHPGQRLLRFVTWDDERNFMTQSTRFATNVLFSGYYILGPHPGCRLVASLKVQFGISKNCFI